VIAYTIEINLVKSTPMLVFVTDVTTCNSCHYLQQLGSTADQEF